MKPAPGQHVSPNSPKSSESRKPIDSTFQSVPSQRHSQSEPACMAPRALAIQQAGFSEEVATRIEAPQRRSTRAIYESKWSVFVRWCEEHKVDFGSPSIKQIADFLLFLFQEKHLQPSTIDGYRTAIYDKIRNGQVNNGKDENLTRLLDSFHRDKPKGRRGVPGTFPWFFINSRNLLLSPLGRLALNILPLRRSSFLPWGRAKEEVRFMPGCIRTLDIRRIGLMFHCTLPQASSPRTIWLRRVRVV